MSQASRKPGGAGVGRAGRYLGVLGRRVCRRALLVGVTACALVGALTSPAYVALVVAPAFGIVAAGVVAILGVDIVQKVSVRRAAVLSAAWAALLVPALAGVGVLGNAGVMILFALMVVGAVLTGSWIVETCAPSREIAETSRGAAQAGRAAARPGTGVAQLRQLIRVLPTSMLLNEWRSTGEHMQTGAARERRAEAVLVRTLLLEELSRRDPAGVERWLSEGDEDAPEQYLRGDSTASP